MATQPASVLRPFCRADFEYAFSVAMKFVRHPDDAADIAQEALLAAHRFRHTFRGDSRFTTWLYRIVATQCLMHLRKQRRLARGLGYAAVPSELAPDPLAAVPDPGPSPEDTAAERETLQCMNGITWDLDPGPREAFLLRFAWGWDEDEIGKRQGVPAATAKTRAYRARSHVQRQLATRQR